MAKKILVVGLALVASLVLAEIGLRVVGFHHPNFYRVDPATGSALVPGAAGWYTAEGRAYVRINSDGMRDREHPLNKPQGTIRVAVLGDSYAEAMQVAEDKTFWRILEAQLTQCDAYPGTPIEVLNFGVSGYGTGQSLMALRSRVWKYAPDIVLLAFLSGNDVSDNVRELKQAAHHPYFVYQDGQLEVDESFVHSDPYLAQSRWPKRVFNRARRSLRLVQLIAAARQALQARGNESAHAVGIDLGLSAEVYASPASSVWKEAWRVTEGLLALMHREVRDKGAHFRVVTLSNPIQVDPDLQRQREVMDRLGVEDLFYPERRIAKAASRIGFPLLSLAPKLAEYARTTGEYWHGFGDKMGSGHWNEAGHAKAGELIATWLCDLPLR